MATIDLLGYFSKSELVSELESCGCALAGVENDLVLLRRVRGAVRSSRPVGKYIKRHEVHHCYDLIKR